MEKSKFELQPYLNLAWRRKWWIFTTAVLVFSLGALYAKVSPKLYMASSRVLIQPQGVSATYIQPTVSESLDARIQSITHQIHSRTNLENIIHEFNLSKGKLDIRQELAETATRALRRVGLERWARFFHSPEPQLPVQSLVEDLRQQIRVVTMGQSRRGGQILGFEIRFVWHDPDVVAPVANAVAASFVETNLQFRQQLALSTTDFLDRETRNIERELEARERELQRFKEEHMGMLPEQLQSNVNILNQLREELNSVERSLHQERERAIMLQSANVSLPSPRGGSGNEGLTGGTLRELQTRLESLSLKYTDRHPDIVALKREIESRKAAGENIPAADPLAEEQRSVQQRIRDYERQAARLSTQIEEYKQRVEQTPHVEMAMVHITRDYTTVQQKYQNLLARRLEAKMAEEMERREQSEQFRILDRAVPPENPFKPDMRKILALALAAGLGMGGGMAYIREMLDPKFYNPSDVAASLDTKVLVTLPSLGREFKETKS